MVFRRAAKVTEPPVAAVEKAPVPTSKLAKQVQFEFTAPEAKLVAVAGSFNNWKTSEAKLTKQPNGKWTAVVDLAPGRYEYRYVVDGRWCSEQRAVEAVTNPFGTANNVVEVK